MMMRNREYSDCRYVFEEEIFLVVTFRIKNEMRREEIFPRYFLFITFLLREILWKEIQHLAVFRTKENSDTFGVPSFNSSKLLLRIEERKVNKRNLSKTNFRIITFCSSNLFNCNWNSINKMMEHGRMKGEEKILKR